MNKDLAGGLALLLVSSLYWYAMGMIADSTLSDEVGPTGLPHALVVALVGLALILTTRGLMLLASTARATADAGRDEEDEYRARPSRAFGFLGLGIGYVMLLPIVSYVIAIGLLIAAVALYEGARLGWRVPATALFGSALFWLIFVKLLGVAEPDGLLF